MVFSIQEQAYLMTEGKIKRLTGQHHDQSLSKKGEVIVLSRHKHAKKEGNP